MLQLQAVKEKLGIILDATPSNAPASIKQLRGMGSLVTSQLAQLAAARESLNAAKLDKLKVAELETQVVALITQLKNVKMSVGEEKIVLERLAEVCEAISTCCEFIFSPR